MMRLLLTVLVLSIAFAYPAFANWFSNPGWNINLNVGSAENPTPADLQAGRTPMLVRDAAGNVIAMVDPATGKVLATAEPAAPVLPSRAAAVKAPAAPSVR